jgi:hypothetical protein
VPKYHDIAKIPRHFFERKLVHVLTFFFSCLEANHWFCFDSCDKEYVYNTDEENCSLNLDFGNKIDFFDNSWKIENFTSLHAKFACERKWIVISGPL